MQLTARDRTIIHMQFVYLLYMSLACKLSQSVTNVCRIDDLNNRKIAQHNTRLLIGMKYEAAAAAVSTGVYVPHVCHSHAGTK